jgi:hypothetical protein
MSSSRDGELSYRLVQRIADAEGVEERALEPPLNEVIDVDALESLFPSDTGIVTFEYHGYEVTVTHSERISIEAQ